MSVFIVGCQATVFFSSTIGFLTMTNHDHTAELAVVLHIR